MDYARGGSALISLSTSEFGGFVEDNGGFPAMRVLRIKDDLIALSEIEKSRARRTPLPTSNAC